MATTSVYSLLRYFASRQNSAQINYAEFCEYMRRYAQHHLNEAPELLPFATNSQDAVSKELALLEEKKKVFIVSPETDRKSIVVVAYFIDKFTTRYKEIQNNISIPFPVETDLPKHIPIETFEKKSAVEFFLELLEKQVLDDNSLYGIVFPHELPILLLPSTISITTLLDLAISKIRLMLRKEEYHDYFLKKIRIANPGKELVAKNFFNLVTTKPNESLESLKTSNDSFYFWNQLCYFIRQDYEKVKDYTQEDLCLLQSVSITEIAISFYKNKAQKDLQRETALKNLELIMNKPPYYFNKDSIVRFVDSRGIPLLGQYSEDDLNLFLHQSTTSMEKNNLPALLVFKLENEQRYFIYKTKVLPLVVRLCSDARDLAREQLTREWHDVCKRFETDKAMKDQKAFNDELEKIVRQSVPVLYSLLNSNFLSLVHYESRSAQDVSISRLNLYSDGKLQPYSDLLMLSRQEILTDAKILLPFWYTIPIISWIAAFLLKRPKKIKAPKNEKIIEKTELKDDDENEVKTKDSSRKEEFKNAAIKIEQELVPENSTLEREISSYAHQWNRLIDKVASANLTEDVNSLIRDYLRRVLRTTKSSNFTMGRIDDLASTLCRTPNLQKIKDQQYLHVYIKLYILKLVKNL